jgi:predicted HNH restriction endonuclease
MHHQKPIFMFADEEFERKVALALDNLIPVCSNCHRMIHRNRNNPLTLEQVKSYLSSDLMFCK